MFMMDESVEEIQPREAVATAVLKYSGADTHYWEELEERSTVGMMMMCMTSLTDSGDLISLDITFTISTDISHEEALSVLDISRTACSEEWGRCG
jgi:hypothetical protein